MRIKELFAGDDDGRPPKPTMNDLYRLFMRVNKDIQDDQEDDDDEEPVDLSDVEFYTDQIFAWFETDGITRAEALQWAQQLAQYVKTHDLPSMPPRR